MYLLLYAHQPFGNTLKETYDVFITTILYERPNTKLLHNDIVNRIRSLIIKIDLVKNVVVFL